LQKSSRELVLLLEEEDNEDEEISQKKFWLLHLYLVKDITFN
jgi:hypothetical protein